MLILCDKQEINTLYGFVEICVKQALQQSMLVWNYLALKMYLEIHRKELDVKTMRGEIWKLLFFGLDLAYIEQFISAPLFQGYTFSFFSLLQQPLS